MLETLLLKPSQLLLTSVGNTGHLYVNCGMTPEVVSANIQMQDLIGTIQFYLKRQKEVLGGIGVWPVPQMPMCGKLSPQLYLL